MKEKIVMVLRKYSPPLTVSQVDEIAGASMVEWRKAVKQLTAEQKKKESKASGKAKKRL